MMIVPGRQGIRAMRNSIPLAGAPTSFEASLCGLLFFCSARFLLVVSRQRRAPCSLGCCRNAPQDPHVAAAIRTEMRGRLAAFLVLDGVLGPAPLGINDHHEIIAEKRV